MKPYPVVLTIAGSDSSACAGVQADSKALHACNTYAVSAITAITAQNTRGVVQSVPLPAEQVLAQINAVVEDFQVSVIKLGMLATNDIVNMLVDVLPRLHLPVVLDPVVLSTSGHPLLCGDGIDRMIERLLPLASLITPNVAELALISAAPEAENQSQLLAQAKALSERCDSAVLVKGGHWQGEKATDWLVDKAEVRAFSSPRLEGVHCRGTGCTLASMIAAGIARGMLIPDAVAQAKQSMQSLLEKSRHYDVGLGDNPLIHECVSE